MKRAKRQAPRIKNDWERRCYALYQVIGSLAWYTGVFEHKDVNDALDVAIGNGDLENLLPWPKDAEYFTALDKAE